MFIFGWIVLSLLAGYFAVTSRRGFFKWFFLSLLFSPFLVFIILIIMRFDQREEVKSSVDHQ